MTHHDHPRNGDNYQPLPLYLELSQEELNSILAELANLARQKGIPKDSDDVFQVDGESKPVLYEIPIPPEIIAEIYTHDQPDLVVKDAELAYLTLHRVDDDPRTSPLENILLSYECGLHGTDVDVDTAVFIKKIDNIALGHPVSGDVDVSYSRNGMRVDLADLPAFEENDFVDGVAISDEVIDEVRDFFAQLNFMRHKFSYDDAQKLRSLIELLK